MTTEVSTKQELTRALLRNVDEIHVNDEKLALGIITRPKKHRMVFYVMQVNGYQLNSTKCLGMFDVRFTKQATSA